MCSLFLVCPSPLPLPLAFLQKKPLTFFARKHRTFILLTFHAHTHADIPDCDCVWVCELSNKLPPFPATATNNCSSILFFEKKFLSWPTPALFPFRRFSYLYLDYLLEPIPPSTRVHFIFQYQYFSLCFAALVVSLVWGATNFFPNRKGNGKNFSSTHPKMWVGEDKESEVGKREPWSWESTLKTPVCRMKKENPRMGSGHCCPVWVFRGSREFFF